MNTKGSPWRVLATSVRGTSHEKTGQPCQDAHDWRVLPAGMLIAAVADGAGSASLSEVGASVASRTAVETISTQTATARTLSSDDEWRQFVIDILHAARKSLEAEAEKCQVLLRDLATTLIVVIATPGLVAAAQVGDGATVVGDCEGNFSTLTAPQSGEYANETTFLTSDDALANVQTVVWRGSVASLAVFSDGLQRLALKMPEAAPHPPFFSPLFRFLTTVTNESEAHEQFVAFLRSPRVTARTDDDLTLVLAAYSS